MTAYNPHTMAEVRQALGNIADDVVVEGLPLPELPGRAHRFRSTGIEPDARVAPELAFHCRAARTGWPGGTS